MIKALAITAAATAAAIAPTAALAFAPEPYEIFGHRGTVIERGSWQRDTITLSGPSGRTTLEVLCTGGGGNEWNAWGTASQAFNQAVADDWCRYF